MDRRLVVAAAGGVLIADGGDTRWTTTGGVLDGRPGCALIDGRRPDRILIGSYRGGLVLSEDGGERFEPTGVDEIEPESVTALAVDPTDPDRLYAGTEPSRLYISEDGGHRWSAVDGLETVPSADTWSFPPRPDTHHVRWIEPDPNESRRLYIGIEAGALVVTPDGGESWIDRPSGSRVDNHTMATHPDAPGRVYAAAGDGYAESTDRGASWQPVQQGLDHRYVWGLAVDTGDPDTVVVSAARGATSAHREPGESYLYRRTGDTDWCRLDNRGVPTGHGHRRAVLVAGPSPGEFYAATVEGVYRSTDAGDAWHRLPIEVPEAIQGALPRGLDVCDRP